MCRQPLSTFYFFCFNILCAQSENTTIAPAMIAVSFITLKSASNLNGNLNCSKELEHYAS